MVNLHKYRKSIERFGSATEERGTIARKNIKKIIRKKNGAIRSPKGRKAAYKRVRRSLMQEAKKKKKEKPTRSVWDEPIGSGYLD